MRGAAGSGGGGGHTRAGKGGEKGREALDRLRVPAGLCAECVHLRLLASRRSVFVRCGLADADPAFPKYPPLPVVACDGFRPESL